MTKNNIQKKIPDGWKFHELNDLVTFVVDNRGKTPPTEKEGIPMVEVNAVGEKNIKYSEVTKYVSEETYKTWFRKHLEKNDVLFSTVGRTASCSLYAGDVKTVIAQNLIGLRFGNDNSLFMFYLLTQEGNNQKFKNIEMSGAQPSVKVSQMIYLSFLTPPLPEQTRIVKVLETWDKAIGVLAKKIEHKKEIKKGLMQNLLTGKIRLPGFSDKWKTVRLKTLVEIVSGGTPSTDDDTFWNGNIPWVTPTEITKLKGRYISETERKLTGAGLKNSSATLIPKYSLILCSRATIGEIAINAQEITTNQGFKNIIPRDVDVYFLYYWMKQNKKQLLRISAGSTFLEFNKKDLEKIKILIPIKEEQVAIGKMLALSDDEISELENKLSLLKDQKKFLLNNLITGIIRTPEKI